MYTNVFNCMPTYVGIGPHQGIETNSRMSKHAWADMHKGIMTHQMTQTQWHTCTKELGQTREHRHSDKHVHTDVHTCIRYWEILDIDTLIYMYTYRHMYQGVVRHYSM